MAEGDVDGKQYFINIIAKFFCLDVAENCIENIRDDECFEKFLNDPFCSLFSVSASNGSLISSNEVPSAESCASSQRRLTLLKGNTSSFVTSDNLKSAVLVLAHDGSPVSSFYCALKTFYIPVLHNCFEGKEPQLQKVLIDLESRLRFASCRISENKDYSIIASVLDEISYWKIAADSSGSAKARDEAKEFVAILRNVEQDFINLNSAQTVDLDAVIDETIVMLDELWCANSYSYPQKRMEKLMDVIGDSIVFYWQRRLGKFSVWTEDYNVISDIIDSGISACSKWNKAIDQLCTVDWSGSSLRRWEGGPPVHELASAFAARLAEVKGMRSAHRQLTKLLSASEKKEMETDSSFSYLNGLKPEICSVYTESQWKSAVSLFEKSLLPAEKRVSIKLKNQLRHLKANALQLLQEFKRYRELIKRPTILSILAAERENLLALLQQYIDNVDIYEAPVNSLLEVPPVVSKIYRVRELKSKVQDVAEVNSELLHDLSGCAGLEKACTSLLDQLARIESEHFQQWIDGINEKINGKELTLSTESKVLQLNKNKMTEVNYDPALFRLIREIQQLSVMGFRIPAKIRELSERAKKFANQAMSLEQIANFYNNVGGRIIPSQRPMLLPVAQELDGLMNVQQGVTWSDAEAVDKYIVKLREVVERLSKECNKLAFYHNQIRVKVIHLMDDDIIRQNNAWKQGLRDIKDIVSHVESLKFPHMESWKLHWDYQLYKALERQYQLRLCNLHSHFPEFKVELIYRQQKLQFQPPIEEIRLRYYGQVKKFLSIPSSFRGVSDGASPLFATIIPRNASRFGSVFVESECLFQELEKVRQKWSKWVSLGLVNLEELIEENLKEADDWDYNFRASKTLAQEIAKLQCNDERVGCISVSILPIRGEMELHNRRYWDALVASLQRSILRDVAFFENYIAEASQVLGSRPKTISQIGEAHVKHARLMEDSSKMLKELESIARKNKVLANWTKEKIEPVGKILSQWDNFQSNLVNYQSLIGRQVEGMKGVLQGEIDNLLMELEKFEIRWNQLRPKETDIQDISADAINKNLILIKEKSEEWSELISRKEKLLEDYGRFDLPKPDFKPFEKVEADLSHCKTVWTFYEEFHSDLNNFAREEWIFFRNKLYRLDEFLCGWEKKAEERETSALTVRMLQEINDYKALIPILKYVRGEMFSDKHWLEMFSILEMRNKSPENLTLEDFLSVKNKIVSSEDQLQELNGRAASEISIRQALNELEAWEVQARFTLAQHSDSKDNVVMVIKDFAEVLNKIGDNQCLLQSILNSPNSKNFADRAGIWETKLTNLEESVRNLNLVQRKWVYLEPIFQNGNFAMEPGRFERVDQDFRHVMSELCKDNHVIALTRIVNINQTLNLMIDQLARCQNSLKEYLQEKRTRFPRFYFLGDDDLLELLGQSAKEKVIQTHVKKIFSGVSSVVMANGVVKGIKSQHGEVVDLFSPVQVTDKIEEWLTNLNDEISKTLKRYVCEYEAKYASGDADLTKLPSQVLCLGESLRFTTNCEEYITNGKLQEFYKACKAKLDSDARASLDWNSADDVLEMKLKALVLEEIHHMKVVETLLENNVTSLNDWHWQKQLRYYMTSERNVIVKMLDAELEYSYEYQGNNPKLVRTELTEKCFLTLTQAMHMGLGGNPFGPAGTGKTESVKALGALLGRQVLVFNCDEGIDIKSMARIFVGLIKCGAWGCFDEFNRLEETTLSAVSMLIQPIQTSLRGKKKTVLILDQEVEMNKNCGIFVTLNPAGKEYGGRQKLPDNLKQLFRPVIMSVPDREEIAQVELYCEGYKNAKTIGRKLVEVFNLAKSLLSKRQHYDWGLRALKTVLWSCGNLFKEAHKNKKLENVSEMEIAVEALRFNTLSKLTFSDSILFDQIVQSVFFAVEFIKFDKQNLDEALKSSAEDAGLQISEYQIKKCIELYEQMQQRMGVAVIGPSGSGKTTIIKLLKLGLEKMGRNVKCYIMNPKSMPRSQLLGHIDLDTRQWTEGVLTNSALKLHAAVSDVWSWLICDGDVDPDWVEALNSVLDDNRLLTLPSGWRIQFGPNVNFLFETCNLNHASPATVSRMGIVYFSDESIDVSLSINSWLKHQDEESKQFLDPYISDYFYDCVEWIRKNCSLAVPFSVLGLVNNGLSHLNGVKCKPHFVISLIHGLGANLTYESRKIFAKYVFESMGEFIQDPSKILDCYFNRKRERIDTFPIEEGSCNVREEFPPILTPSAKTTLAILEPWVNSHQPILISGSEGCGKNLLLKSCLSKLPATEVATIHCSALLSPLHVVQKLKEICLVRSSSTGRMLRPKNSQKLILYFKNLEFAVPDKWGTNMLTAWLQQVIAYNGFYDTDLEWTNFEGIQIIASLGDGGSVPCQRLTSLMRIYSHNPPEEYDLKLIYSQYVKSIVEDHFGRYKALSAPSRVSSLVSTLVNTYQEVRKNFSQITHKSYCFSPRCLTQWCSGLRRYSLEAGNPIKSLLTAVAYEALRLFCDRLTTEEDRRKMKDILTDVIDGEWNQNEIVQHADDLFFVTDGDRKMLTCLTSKEWSQVVGKGIQMSLGNESDIIVVDELLRLTSCIDRSLSVPKTSLTLCGKCGVGRKTALKIVTSLHGSRLITINMSHEYGLKNLKMDLKAAFQVAGVEGEPACLVVEGYQLTNDTFVDMMTSLLCYGQVPGLYAPEELESIISQLKNSAPMDGFSGTAASYFAQRVVNNLHVVLLLDFDESYFPALCESSSKIFTKCEVVWSGNWSASTMKIVPRALFSGIPDASDLTSDSNMPSVLADVHDKFKGRFATPRRYMSFVQFYVRLYTSKRKANLERASGLRTGVRKLTETRAVVDNLKTEANKQEVNLAEKQTKAARALDLIGETMKNANIHKGKMEKLKEKIASENKTLMERKKAIDKELAEVEPLIGEARQAVGNIKNEALSEIRSLRAPPDVIRDILEGVLRLMGIQDTSWNSMKTFLAKRGIKEEIRTFDANRISADNMEAVENLLNTRRDSFDSKIAKRASVAAAPLAAWVKANITYAKVLEKILPLEKEQLNLEENLKSTEGQMDKLCTGLGEVDKNVAELKEQLATYTREAAVIEINLAKAKETMNSAQELVSKLDDEYNRWRTQLTELSEELTELPKKVLIASAFVTYLASSSEEVRECTLTEWEKEFDVCNFSLTDFLGSDKDKLKWVSEGLSLDGFSTENATIIMEANLPPLLIDPEGVGLEWLKKHLEDDNLDVTSQSSARFQASLELAVRFGKNLIVEEMDEVSPVLMPILRKNLTIQGPRQTVYVGEKMVDYHKNFRIFLVTRRTDFNVPADVLPISFATTRKGLAKQLLSLAVEHERPELERRRKEILKGQEQMKSKLFSLQEILLKELSSAQGDILQNTDLLLSLNQTKTSSEDISKALSESRTVGVELEKECEAFKPVSEFFSDLYFTVASLSKMSVMTSYSIQAFKKLFLKGLKSLSESESSFDSQRLTMIKLVYNYVSRSLFKADRLTFALHLVQQTFSECIQPKEWKVFTGEAIAELDSAFAERETLPGWIEEDRFFDINMLRSALPQLFDVLKLSESEEWIKFVKSGHCENEFPKHLPGKLSSFQLLLVMQALRPDRLLSYMTKFCSKVLHLETLSPSSMRLSEIFEESINTEPILLIISPGADPSKELTLLSKTTRGMDLREVALGQGQTSVALEALKSCAESGQWLCLKNLHLMTSWLRDLEKELRMLKPNENFRLWLTTESHSNFSPVLANNSLKVVYEVPAGIKKNLQRTYGSWTSEMFRRKGVLFARTMFAAAWLHAVIQERRSYIPQGWTKFYEITDADLLATSDLISRIFQSGIINWNFLHGVLLDTIYGNRVENEFDDRILATYVREFFSEATLSQGREFGPSLTLPSSESYPEYLELIHHLADFDKPSYFGLPENIERSWQKLKSSQVIDQIKVLHQPGKTNNFDVKSWQEHLFPILNLWKKLQESAGLLEANQVEKKKTSQSKSEDPLHEFFHKDLRCGLRTIRVIHSSLTMIDKVMRGIILPGREIIKISGALLSHQTPSEWQNCWEGPENPMKFMRAVTHKTCALRKMQQKQLDDIVLQRCDVDLSDFLQPEMFLMAIKQLSGRKLNVPLDELEHVCDWKGSLKNCQISIRIKNLQLEGAVFNGRAFARTSAESPSVTAAPPVQLAFVKKESRGLRGGDGGKIVFPVYQTSERIKAIVTLPVPCEGSRDDWFKAAPAFFLRESEN